MQRKYRLTDRLLAEVDAGLRTVACGAHASRLIPTTNTAAQPAEAIESERLLSARLMRVNHTGEVCAQALYRGQAVFARAGATRELLYTSAKEEVDHLAWCETRIDQLGGRTSRLNPAFYVGSFALGLVSGALSDRWSLGFLVETERQVERHLSGHLEKLPATDHESRAVLKAMRDDERHHADTAQEAGGQVLPSGAKAAMRVASRVMTGATFWV